MSTRPAQESRNRRELLAGNCGRCSDYQRTGDLGRGQEPFTWLSDDGSDESNVSLEDDLKQLQRRREAVRFEVHALEGTRWTVLMSGSVRIIYVECDTRLSKVRALLQWVPGDTAQIHEEPLEPPLG